MSELEKYEKQTDFPLKFFIGPMGYGLLFAGGFFMFIDLVVFGTIVFIVGVIMIVIKSRISKTETKEKIEQTKKDEESVDDTLDKF